MSHFTRMKTTMVRRDHLIQALQDLDYDVEIDAHVQGFQGNQTKADVKINTAHAGYDIGFRQQGSGYEMVADWWGITSMDKNGFLQKVTQRYAYHATLAELTAQGFNLVQETNQENQQIRLVLRRMA